MKNKKTVIIAALCLLLGVALLSAYFAKTGGDIKSSFDSWWADVKDDVQEGDSTDSPTPGTTKPAHNAVPILTKDSEAFICGTVADKNTGQYCVLVGCTDFLEAGKTYAIDWSFDRSLFEDPNITHHLSTFPERPAFLYTYDIHGDPCYFYGVSSSYNEFYDMYEDHHTFIYPDTDGTFLIGCWELNPELTEDQVDEICVAIKESVIEFTIYALN